jgi:hypothetical protein
MSDYIETDNYEVGYGKPPKSGQFKKGASGNPSGRPKKALDVGSQVARELNSKLTINENGKRKVITKLEALAKQLVNKGISGNSPAARIVLTLHQQALEKAPDEHQRALDYANLTPYDLSDGELALFIRDERKRLGLDCKTASSVIEPSSSTEA